MIGKTLAHYRIDAELGRGGMGVVYRAFDQKLRRDVALKVLRESLLVNAGHRERLLAEARAASPLNHPGIATIYEVIEQDDLLVIVMEFVDGETLREKLRQSLAPRELVGVAMQIAEALNAAHTGAVVHGDVKPENVVVQADGRIKLLDFGVARSFAREAATATVTDGDWSGDRQGYVAGTVAYMAPECFRGSSADPRSDLFSLGVLLYEMASGRRPFPGPDASSLAQQILDDPVPRIDSSSTTLPAELDRIVRKLLEKDTEARYQTARDLRIDLANLLRDLELGPTLSTAAAGRRSVAVLPFHLLMPKREDEYLSVALADAIINVLGTSPQLLIRPSSAVQRYAKERADPLVAARELNVEVIVEGNIQKLGPQMRVHVQVWNAADGSTLLSTKHDAEVTELFALQDRIAESLFDSLGVDPETPDNPPARDNPQAYELFLRAVDRMSQGNRWDTRTAVEMLRSVVELDPGFAEAWARLAQACVAMGFSFEPGADWTGAAEEAIERALSLDPTNVQARVARGRVLWSPDRGFQNRAALEALGDAVRINPRSHQAMVWRALIFMHVGLLPEALAGLNEALTIEPNDPFTLNFAGQVHEFLGNYEQACSYQVLALSHDPTHQFALLFVPTSLVHLGRLDEAERRIRSAKTILGEDKMLVATEAMIWARRGDSVKAAERLQAADSEGRTVAHSHHAWHHIASTHALLDRPEEAVRWLEKAATTGLPNHPLFSNDAHLARLKGEAGFDALIRRLETECAAYRSEFVR